MIWQKEIELPAFSRGYHLITDRVLNEVKDWPETGILSVFIKHTSAAITISENFDPAVRVDFENFLSKLIPDDPNMFTHTMEGIDDMPAHIKASFTGSSINIPITNGQVNLGQWQGIYLCEYRHKGGSRKIVITIYS
jgi:secondary thiamine-phosphate synthase enzyme